MKIYKFLHEGHAHFGVGEQDGMVRALRGSPFDGDMILGDERWPLVNLQLLAPTAERPRIFGIGLNYRSHILETGRSPPEIPSVFMKPDTSLLAPGGSIVYPRGSTVVHYEAELVAVIGRRARHVREEDALSYVLGYTCGNDVSERTIQRQEMAMGLMTLGKAFDSFAPIGPCIETALDPRALRLQGRLNGGVVQEGDTADLLFGVAALVAYLSRAITLLPGDLIMTGTPGGVGPVEPGDVVEIEIEGIGTLSNPVVAEGA